MRLFHIDGREELLLNRLWIMARLIGRGIDQADYHASQVWNRWFRANFRPWINLLVQRGDKQKGLQECYVQTSNKAYPIRPLIWWNEGPLQVQTCQMQRICAPDQRSAWERGRCAKLPVQRALQACPTLFNYKLKSTCKAVSPGRLVQGLGLNWLIFWGVFLSFQTVVTSRNILVFKIFVSPAEKWLSKSRTRP